MEICCDFFVFFYIKDEEVKEYGFIIINMIDYFLNLIFLIGIIFIVNNKFEVRRRIIMIKLFDKKVYRFFVMVVVLLFIIGGIVFIDVKVVLVFNSNNNGVVNVDKIDYFFVNDFNIIGEW